MTDRIYAIANFNKEDFDYKSVFESLPFKENTEVYFFTVSNKFADEAKVSGNFKEVYLFDPEFIHHESKMRNLIVEKFFTEKCKSFVHVISDALPIKNGNLDKFVPAIEEMMDKLDQVSWFSTRSDPCNYVFEKYNPKFIIGIDEKNLKNYNKTVLFTPFANTAWTIFDFSKVTDIDAVKFNDSFRIPMFYIVEFLSRRRKYQPAFMNCYPTVEEERWVFDPSSMFVQTLEPEKDGFERKDYEKENEIFMNLKVDFESLHQVEKVFEMICGVLGIDPFAVPAEEVSEKKEQEKNEN